MATAAELEVIINRLRRNIEVSERLIVQRDRLLANPDLSEAQRRTGEIVQARNREVLANQQRELAEAEQALARAQTPGLQPQPPDTASQTAAAEAPAGPNAVPAQQVNAAGDVVTPRATTTPTNAEVPATAESGAGVDTGTNPPIRTFEQTQATTPSQTASQPLRTTAPTGAFRGQRSDVAPTSPGVGEDDENPPPSTGTKQAELNATQNGISVRAQPNILDKYSSYTYVASVYLCTQAQYTKLLGGTDKKIDGYQLLFQSGGAPTSDGTVRPNQIFTQQDPKDPTSITSSWQNFAQASRNPFFDADFYIDTITLETVPTGKGSGAAHMNATLKFTVVEPLGITLLNRLYKAVQNFAPSDATNKVNYTSAIYLMVIRFYGYDQNGNLVMPIRGGLQTPGETSDPTAVVEKFIPFQINRINWGVSSKLVTYEWDCTPIGQLHGAYSARGTIPYDVQLTNTTVGGLLKGPAKYSTIQPPAATPGAATTTTTLPATQASVRAVDNAIAAGTTPTAPPNATAAPTPKKAITQGLVGALNEYQQELVNNGIYTIPDEYEIEFLGTSSVSAAAIENAKLQLANQRVDKSKTAGGAPPTKDVNSARPESNPVNMNSRSVSITAGQQILQVIELAIRNSSYIADQALVVVDPNGKQSPSPNTKNSPLQWFNIAMSATPKSGGLDPKRNDNAYKIKYTVTPFLPANVASKYFPPSKFNGVHKSYPYWFTGKNTAVRDYQETLNAMYTLTVSGNAPNNSAAAVTADAYTSSMQEIVKYNYSPASNASRAGADGKSLEPSANAAEVLYSPGDLAQAKLKIIGDPAWIMQGSMFKPLNGQGFAVAAKTGFEPDGTISFDSQDILFEIVWQRPEDFDINTGIADPYKRTTANGQARQALQSRVYICTKVVSEFKNGAFEQTLDGSLYLFPKPDKSNTANPAASVSADASADAGRSRVALPPGTSDAGAGRSSSQFNARDPRRLDIGDGGKAAVLGAQGAYNKVKFAENAGGAAFGNPNLTRQGITAGANTRLENAPPPEPPTTTTGGSVATAAAQRGTEPPKLPEGGVTPGQASAARTAQRVADLRARAAGTAPTYRPGQIQDTEY